MIDTLWHFIWLPLVFAAALTAGLGGWFFYWLILKVWHWLTAEPLTFTAERERFRHEREIHAAVSPFVDKHGDIWTRHPVAKPMVRLVSRGESRRTH